MAGPQDAARLTVAAFGNSLTARATWPQALQRALTRCLGRPVTVTVIAGAGVTSDWANGQIDRVVALRPDVVLVQFAENDAAIDRLTSLRSSRAAMGRVFEALRHGLPQARIFNMAMNPASGLRGWMRPYLSAYIEAHRAEATSRGVGFIDFRPAWNALTPHAIARTIPDGLHPDATAAADIMIPILLRHLATDGCRTN